MSKPNNKVSLFSKEGDFIKTFDSAEHASKELNNKAGSIRQAIRYKTLIQNKYRVEYDGAINIRENLPDSYLRIRITSKEKAELKNFAESKDTTMTGYVKSLIDEYIKNNP
jgi:hypothetical protein